MKWTELAEPYIFRFMEKQKLVKWELFLMTSPRRRFGIPDIFDACGFKYIREHSMTPPNLVNELQGFEQFVFRKFYAGNLTRKLYRLYEYQKG